MTAPVPLSDPDFRPRLRPGLRATPTPNGDAVTLFDPMRVSANVLAVSPVAVEIANLFDGSRTVREVHALLAGAGASVPLGQLTGFVSALDEALLLDGPKFREYVNGPVRRPTCVGCYPQEPEAIREQLRGLFTQPAGPGLPKAGKRPDPDHRLRAVFAPHMDYDRGGVTYGWAYKELAEQTDARLFVIVGTSHYSAHRLILTCKHFETPLGVAETDLAYVNRLAEVYGPSAFDDPIAHLPEHSIELEVLMLQYVLAGRGPFRIVPVLVGSFSDCVDEGVNPAAMPDIARLSAALRRAEEAAGEPVCYVISGDLAHIGPKFDDPEPVSEPQLAHSRERDGRLLERLADADHAGFYRLIAQERDERRVCGLPPAWVTLDAIRPSKGKVLHYGRFVHPQGEESVSFAAASFYSYSDSSCPSLLPPPTCGNR